MNRRATVVASLLAALALAAVLAGCGSSADTVGVEGEPIELAGLQYNVQLTRFLNPDDPEDSEYLVGQPPPKSGTYYLGVFMVISNTSDAARPSATGYTVSDTLHNEYQPLVSESPYALDVGADVPSTGQLPLVDTTAQTGPNKGSLLIFQVSDDVSDNRPLALTIKTFDGSGVVTLDI